MKSYEAIQSAVNGKTVEHAKKLHCSTSLVNKWQEPSTDYTDSGAFNPLDRLETIIETSLSLKTAKQNAFAPLQYLGQRFNHIVIPMPDTNNIKIEDLSKELLKTIEDFGILSKESAEAMKDSAIKKNEFKKIEAATWELIRQAAVFLYQTKASVEK